MAVPTPMGTAKSKAKAEVTRVPKMAGATPYTLCTGSKARLVRKLQPNCRMVGSALLTSTQATPATMTTTKRTSNRVKPRKSVSLSRRLLPSKNRTLPRALEKLCCMQHHFLFSHQDYGESLISPGPLLLCSSRCVLRAQQRDPGSVRGTLQLTDSPGVARRVVAAARHRLNLCFIFGDDIGRQWHIVERCGVLLALMRHPPEQVRNSLAFGGVALMLVDNHPGVA